MRILGERELHRVLAPFELSVPVAGYLRSYLGLPGLGFETANLFTNKYLMKRRAAAAGLPVTAFRVAYALADVPRKADEIGWPVVINPVPLRGCPAGFNASYVLPPDHPDLAEILDVHARTVRAFGLRAGVTHMELLKSKGGLLAGEIACRPPGGGIPEGIRLQYGVDIWRAFRETSLGLEPDIRSTERDGLIVNYLLPIKPGRIVRLSTAADLA